MLAEDMILVSVGDQLIEPPHLFSGLLPARFADQAPKVITTDDGADVWTFNGVVLPNVGLNTVAGSAREKTDSDNFEAMRPGWYDSDERVKDMNAGGVLASMCFPSLPGSAGRHFAAADDKDLALAVTRAYNDWHIDEWCGSYPGRFIPLALPIMWDAQLCADEIRRVAEKGCRSLTFSEDPGAHGFPGFHDEYWDPVWRALSETATVVSLHAGSSGKGSAAQVNCPTNVRRSLSPINLYQAAAELLCSRVVSEFPDVRIALVNGGIGWIPYFLDRIDRTFRTRRLWAGLSFGGRLPSEVFRERFLTCFTVDPIGLKLRHDIGVDNIAWQCDYPHGDSSWPAAAEELEEITAGLPDDEMDKITFENVCRWYSFDPFARRPRLLCTVGALREKVDAAHKDIFGDVQAAAGTGADAEAASSARRSIKTAKGLA